MNTEIEKYIDHFISITPPNTDGSITLTTDPGKIWEHFETITQIQQFVVKLSIRYGKQGTVIDQGDVVVIQLK
jgi:hypothetical protein